jgi:uncharacterized membrane protein YhhN
MRQYGDIVIYLLLTVGCILGAMRPEWSDLHLWTKPALTGFLMVLVLACGPWRKASLKVLTLLALSFSMAGDVLLMNDENESFFLFGLGAFLLAHIFYMSTFILTPRLPLEIPFLKRNPWSVFLTAGYIGLLFRELKDDAGHMAGPVLFYAITIGLMLLMALNREKHVSPKSFQLVLIGALLFVISDSLLAWNRFLHPIPNSPIWILGTYAWAQFLIVRGLIKGERML